MQIILLLVAVVWGEIRLFRTSTTAKFETIFGLHKENEKEMKRVEGRLSTLEAKLPHRAEHYNGAGAG